TRRERQGGWRDVTTAAGAAGLKKGGAGNPGSGRAGAPAMTARADAKRPFIDCRRQEKAIAGDELAERLLQIVPGMIGASVSAGRSVGRNVSQAFCLDETRLICDFFGKGRAVQENRWLNMEQVGLVGLIRLPFFLFGRLLRRRKLRLRLRRRGAVRHSRPHVLGIVARSARRSVGRRIVYAGEERAEQRNARTGEIQRALHFSATPMSGATPLKEIPLNALP